ncbi:MAG: hypothetical protein GY906_23515 [bacterium]|nr:hypothetical protein [bacterium]
MRYNFKCDSCTWKETVIASIHEGAPDPGPECACGMGPMIRDWKADAPMIDTSGCKDHSDIPMEKRVASRFDRGTPEQQERAFNQHVQERRKELADGGNRGTVKQTHAVPTHLFHGKIKETGDPKYWDDPKNLARHSECKVSK